MDHIVKGKKGEIIALDYLKNKGYKLIEKNHFTSIGEIDIIMYDQGYIVFVEVKTRSNKKYGRASEAVNKHKQLKIKQNATLYLKRKKMLDANVRFDVVEVYDDEINHIENAF